MSICHPLRSLGIWIATLLAFSLPAGCGGSDSLTKAEYITQADRICLREATVTINGKEAPLPLQGSASFNRDLADDKKAVHDDLEGLAAPADDRAVIDAWLAARDEQIDLLREGAEAQQSRDRARVKSLTHQFVVARQDEFAAASEYGMKVCSRPPGGAQLR